MKKKVLLTSMMSIAMLASIASGATYALFTAEDTTNIAVNAARVKVSAMVDQDSLKTYSLGVEQLPKSFQNGGSATFDKESNLKLDYMTPGDKAKFTVKIDNTSNVDIIYRLTVSIDGELAPALVTKAVTKIGDETKELKFDGKSTAWTKVTANADIADIDVELELPLETGNKYQEKSANVKVFVEALQGNAPTVDTWDGTEDASWFFEDLLANPEQNPEDREFNLNTAEALAGLRGLIEGTVAIPTEAEDQEVNLSDILELATFKLNTDIDLGGQLFDPIGSYRFDQAFKGVFDGQGYTIKNMTQETWGLDNGYYYTDCGLGLFGLLEGATVKNLVMDNASVSGESAICGTVAAVAHNTTFENITIKNSDIADYQYYAGGVVGWASGKINVINCNIDSSTEVAAQWGDFDNSIGGVIGGASGSAEILIKNTTVACRIDAYNDVTSSYQWYAYRRAGMLIGNTGKTTTDENGTTVAAAPQLTCENVTVIYGEWANYTYCEFAGTSWPYVRVQEGVSNSAYSNPRYGHPTDANGNEVVDDNHVHNEGEDHHILCVFDQLYGGGQGVYGTPTHDGVKVIYNNKTAN